MMKTRIRNFLLALTIALISLKLFPALDLYALKSLNKLFFDERAFAVITDMGNAFFITAFIIPALIGYSNFNSKINSVSASILVIPSLVFGLFIQLVKSLVNAPRPAGIINAVIKNAFPTSVITAKVRSSKNNLFKDFRTYKSRAGNSFNETSAIVRASKKYLILVFIILLP